MHIAIDIRCLMEKKLTGVGEYTLNLLKQLFIEDSTNQYYLFYNSTQDLTNTLPRFDFSNVHYCEFKIPNKLLNLSLILLKKPKLDRLIEKKYKVKIDFFFFPNISFQANDCPYFITAHDLSFEIFPEFLSFKRKLWHWLIKPNKLFSAAKKIIAVSLNTKTDLMNKYLLKENKIEVIHSGITSNFRVLPPGNSQLLRVKKKYNLPNKFLLYLGTIEPRKNIETLIQAFELYQPENKLNYDLILVGKPGWHCQKIFAQINNFNKKYKAQIIFKNFIQNQDKLFFYNLAELFIYPSFYEGFGFPPLEAMACGCPVITSANSSLSEVCGDNAILINPYDANEIKNAINQSSENREYFIQKGLAKAAQFNWQTTANRHLDIFNKK